MSLWPSSLAFGGTPAQRSLGFSLKPSVTQCIVAVGCLRSMPLTRRPEAPCTVLDTPRAVPVGLELLGGEGGAVPEPVQSFLQERMHHGGHALHHGLRPRAAQPQQGQLSGRTGGPWTRAGPAACKVRLCGRVRQRAVRAAS
jgi:hypothetical protein